METYYNNVISKSNKSVKDNENFAHRATETSFRIREGASIAEDEYLRCLASLKETLHILYCLHTYDGVIKTGNYNAQVQCLKDAFDELRTRLEIKSYSLVLVENSEIKRVINFDDQYTLNTFCIDNFGCEYTEVENPMRMKTYYGSKVIETEFTCKPISVFETFKMAT